MNGKFNVGDVVVVTGDGITETTAFHEIALGTELVISGGPDEDGDYLFRDAPGFSGEDRWVNGTHLRLKDAQP